MKYVSTRGKAPVLNFEEVLLAGHADRSASAAYNLNLSQKPPPER